MSNTIHCLIVDDEPLAIELIKDHIAKLPHLRLIGACRHALEAFEVLKKEPVDLVFLDIQMPMLTGLEFVRSLQNPPAVIFTTAYRQYAVESYDLNVIDYLLKPITFTRFLQAIDKYLERRAGKGVGESIPTAPPAERAYLFVNENRRNVKVFFDEVLYIESLKDYIRIYTATGSVMTKEKISEFEAKLPASFLRIHRSYIVNVDKVTAYTAHDVEIGELEVPIGVSYRQRVWEVLKG